MPAYGYLRPGMIRVGASAFPYDRKRFNHVHMISLVKRRTAFDCGPIDPPGRNDEMCPKDKPKNTPSQSLADSLLYGLWGSVSEVRHVSASIAGYTNRFLSMIRTVRHAICSSARDRQSRAKAATSLEIVDALF